MVVLRSVERLLSRPTKRSTTIPKPGDLFSDRKNSSGFLWSDPRKSAPMLDAMRAALQTKQTANPIVAGSEPKRESHPVFDPADRRRQIGDVAEVTEDDVRTALETAARAQH